MKAFAIPFAVLACIALSACQKGGNEAADQPIPADEESASPPGAIAEYEEASNDWQDAMRQYLEFSNVEDPNDLTGLVREGKGFLTNVERKFAVWWEVAEPIASEVGGDLEVRVREFVARTEQYLVIQHSMFESLRRCSAGAAGPDPAVLICLKQAGFARTYRQHARHTLWLRQHTTVLVEFSLVAAALDGVNEN